jgi:hypothetical protein
MKLTYVNINNTPIDVLLPADEIKPYEVKILSQGTLVNKLASNNDLIEFDGFITKQFKNELYNQIHVIKLNYDVGYVSEYTQDNIEVWNSYYVSKQITDFSTSSSDITITNPNSLPINLVTNSSENFTLNIEKVGEVVINETFNFTVSSQEIQGTINGIRANLFDFNHSWVNDFQEKYFYYTGINKSVGLIEQRIPLIDLCNYSCQYSYRLKDQDKQKLDAILYNNVNSLIALPLYQHVRRVILASNDIIESDLKNTVYQKNMQVLIKDNNKKEIVTIKEIDLINNRLTLTKNLINLYNNAIIVPVILSRTIEVNTENILPHFTDYTITFEKEIDELDMLEINNNNVVLNKVNSINYLEKEPNFNDLKVNKEYTYNNTVLSNEYGIKAFYEYNKTAEIGISYDYIIFNKDKLSEIKKVFKDNLGAYGDLYLNNFNSDIKIVENINATDTIIIIENINASVFYKNNYLKYIVINYGGTKKILEFNNIYKIDENKEGIVLTENAGFNLNKNSINYCNFLFRGRFGNDDLDISYKNNEITEAKINFIKNVGVE